MSADGELVYYSAAVGIVFNTLTNKQRFFIGHDDDIRCIALHPNGWIAATGQMGKNPSVYIWNVRTMEKMIKVGTKPPEVPSATQFSNSSGGSGGGSFDKSMPDENPLKSGNKPARPPEKKLSKEEEEEASFKAFHERLIVTLTL